MLRDIRSWLGAKTGVPVRAKDVSPGRPAGAPSFEPLEPRLLLNADLPGLQPPLACRVSSPEQAVCVDLNREEAGADESDSYVSVTLPALSDQAGLSESADTSLQSGASDLGPVGQEDPAGNEAGVMADPNLQTSSGSVVVLSGTADEVLSDTVEAYPRCGDSSDECVTVQAPAEAAPRGPPAVGETPVDQILFIDSALDPSLPLPNAGLPGVAVIVLDTGRDSVRQITDLLSAYSNLSAIHLLSHGAPGRVRLGTATLSPSSLNGYADDLVAWGASLADEGDILLYGCRVGAGREGQALLQGLAGLTGAEVAASTDPTGPAEGGGNWVLETATGPVEASSLEDGTIFGVRGLLTAGDLDPTFGAPGKVTTPIGAFDDRGWSVATQSDGKIVVAGRSSNGSNDDFALVRYNSDGSLDTSFDGDGKVTTDIAASSYDSGESVALQSDGKIVVAGASDADFALVRYDPDGSLDTSFGGTGKVTTPLGADGAGLSVALQSDGKIVVAGWSFNGSDSDFALVRYTTDGSLDPSFGGTGTVTTDIGDSSYDFGQSVAIQSDGKIVVAGSSDSGGSGTDFALVRYNADGSLDTSFGDNGKVTTDIGTSDDDGESVAIQSDGKIVVAGWSVIGGNYDFALVRYDPGGSLDTSFDGDGTVTTPIGDSYEQGYSVAIQSDGKIVVAGRSSNGSNDDFALVRYSSNGSLDTSFGGTGKVTTPLGADNDYGDSVAMQSDGKIVVAGYNWNGSNCDFALVCYNPDGSLDASFGGTGKVTTPIGASGDYAQSVALQSDGKIVVAGSSSIGSADFALVRYNPDGSLDPSFGVGGKVTTPLGASSYDCAFSVALQSDGKIVVAGYSNADFALVRYNSDGRLDTSFGVGGKVTTPVGDSSGGESVALQSDGKIVVAGYSSNGSDYDFALIRYNPDGSLDTSFDGDGKVTTPIGASHDGGFSVAIQSNGKIVVAGYSFNASNCDFALVRYNADGSLDASFDGDGKVTTDIGASSYDIGHSVGIQSDGKIVVAGGRIVGGSYDFALVRYNADGSLDASFDGDGKVTTDIGGRSDDGSSVGIQSDGKIVVAGVSDNGSDNDFALVRYNPNGSLDTSFGGTGKVTTDVGAASDAGHSVALQSDGRIVVAGSSFNGSDNDFALVCYNPNGSLDASFGGTGKVTTDIGAPSDEGYSVALQSDGKIVVAGSSFNGSDNDFALVCYNANGSVDTSFGGTGWVTTDIGGAWDYGASVAIQSDGKIVVAGTSLIGGNEDFALVRYNPDGSLDISFDGDGKVRTPIGASTDCGYSVAIQSDGKIVVAGYSVIGSSYDFALVRYTTDGALDPSFGGGDGKVTTDIGGSKDVGRSVALQSDGKIVVAGSSDNGSDCDFALVRYNPDDGSLDTLFGGGTGKVTTDIGASYDSGRSVAIQSDGKIVVAGSSNADFALVRYNAEGSLDTSFGSGTGKVTTDIGASSSDQGYSVALQSDGKIIVAGVSYNGSDNDFALVRYTTDGTLDTSFGGTGKVTTPIGASDDYARSVALQSDGKIVVAGSSDNGSDNDFAVVRYKGDPPEITVLGNGVSIADGDMTPGTADDTDFGIVLLGGSAVSRTFTVRNDGGATLKLGAVTVPSGFTLTEGLSASLGAGASDTFTVRLETAAVGTMTGDISFTTNDSDENPFHFRVSGIVNQPPTQPMGVSPADAAAGVVLTPTLESSAFSDPDAGATHAATQWQVDNDSDFSSPVWDYSDTDADKTGQAMPSGTLSYRTTYFWRMRHQDSQGAWSEWSDPMSFTTRSAVYRFWSPVYSRHFYTTSETERDKLINNYSHIWTYEKVAYSAFADSSQPGVSPVYRFWSGTLNAHFYTMSESEKTKLLDNYSQVWTYERVAFYAYAEGSQPQGATAVYRFWSASLGCHFFTNSVTERDKLINLWSDVWTYEKIAWYAYAM